MGDKTDIGWTDATWNPWIGCHKVSAGCKNCYMYRGAERYGWEPNEVVRSKSKFNDPTRWLYAKRIFTCSWSDWFIEEADQWRAEAWDIIRRTRQHTYQILTKRPERIADHLPATWGEGWPNVWLGTSIENQDVAEKRLPYLLNVKAAVHFVSCEPLLGPVNLRTGMYGGELPCEGYPYYDALVGWAYDNEGDGCSGPSLDWVIVGGESGPDYRPMRLEWLESIVDQCRRTGTPVFVKQNAGRLPGNLQGIPKHLRIQEYPHAKNAV